VTEEKREHHKYAPAEQQHRDLAPGWHLFGLALTVMLLVWRADVNMLGALFLWALL
jgi:hypothetical protein